MAAAAGGERGRPDVSMGAAGEGRWRSTGRWKKAWIAVKRTAVWPVQAPGPQAGPVQVSGQAEQVRPTIDEARDASTGRKWDFTKEESDKWCRIRQLR